MNRHPLSTCLSTRLSPLSGLGLFALAIALGGLLQGCAAPGATTDDAAAAAAAPSAGKMGAKPAATVAPAEKREAPQPVLTPAQQALALGIEAYNKGDFNNAIKRLAVPEIAAGDKTTQITALKYSAFSYCVTKRQTQCYQQFVKAFKLDRSFELAAGEKGHPLWTASFERAKKAK